MPINSDAVCRFAPLALLMAALLVLAACNTVEGAGRDIEALGGGIADTADDASTSTETTDTERPATTY